MDTLLIVDGSAKSKAEELGQRNADRIAKLAQDGFNINPIETKLIVVITYMEELLGDKLPEASLKAEERLSELLTGLEAQVATTVAQRLGL